MDFVLSAFAVCLASIISLLTSFQNSKKETQVRLTLEVMNASQRGLFSLFLFFTKSNFLESGSVN